MSNTTLGFGAFRLEDLLPGEEYFASDGRPCKVHDEQPYLPQYVQIWSNVGTSNAMKMLLPRTALVFGTSPEHARRISRRVERRRRRAKERQDTHAEDRPGK